MKEQAIQKQIIDYLKSKGYYVIKVITANRAGIPDIIACSPEGRFVAIEVKAGTNKPSPLQEYNIGQIKDRQGLAMVVWSLDEVKQVI